MRIETIELANVGRFREKKIVGVLDAGLNILAEPNESGKSTIIKGLTRAFFDRYNASHKELESLRPAGTTLCPQVTVVFSVKGDRYKLKKCFLERNASDLSRWNGSDWERIAESQNADQRVRELLGAPALKGRVAATPEQWGLLQFLWARQGEPAQWFDWSGSDGGKRARDVLVAVKLDPVAEKIGKVLRKKYEVNFTPKDGRVRANSGLKQAQQRLAELDTQLASVREKRGELEALEQQYGALRTELEKLTQRRESTTRNAEALKTQADQAERLMAKMETLEAELKNASDALARITADQDSVRNATKAIEQAETDAKAAQTKLDDTAKALPLIEREIENTQSELAKAVRQREQAQARMNRIHALIRLRQLTDELAALQTTQKQAAALADEAVRLSAEKAKLPALTPKHLKEWRHLDGKIRELRAQIEASGLTVTLCAMRSGAMEIETDHGRRAVHFSADAPETIKSPQSLTLHLPGWGTVRIASGAAEVRELETQLREQEQHFASALAEAGLTKLEEAETSLVRLVQIEQQIEKNEGALRAHLDGRFESAAELGTEVARRGRTLSNQRESLAPSSEEQALALAALQAETEKASAAAEEAAETEKQRRTLLDEQTTRRNELRIAHEQAQGSIAALDKTREVHAKQRTRILELYDDDLAGAHRAAQSAFVQAKALHDETKRALPEDARGLVERSKQATEEASLIELEFQRKTNALRDIEAELKARGGEGLYSQESALEEQIEQTRAEESALRRCGWAQRLVFELIERRERLATGRVLHSLEDRLSADFAELSGARDRRVFFNEKLEITGIGARREEAHPFSELSQGGKEQLLLALRAAIAQKLAEDEPPLLVLDDVLVHTDAARQKKVLKYLQSLASRMQILVLTCHADRYRGAGKIITLNNGANEQ